MTATAQELECECGCGRLVKSDRRGKLNRFIVGHQYNNFNSLASFWKRVTKTPTCWIWIGAVGSHGYGNMRVKKKQIPPHRYSYELHRGSIPTGLAIDHLCRNRRCVNPDHMEAVSLRENVLRGLGPTANNRRKETCHRGHPFSYRETWGRRGRRCRQCSRILDRNRRARLKASIQTSQSKNTSQSGLFQIAP